MIIQVGQNQYNLESKGSGEPLVLFHGFTGSTRTWDRLVEQLSGQFQCITVDLPGHGKTKANIDSMEHGCSEILQALKEFSIQKFNLLGYSMGGRTALIFAAMYPEHISRLILEGASPGLDGDAKKERAERDHKLASFIEENGSHAFVDYWETVPLFKTQEKLSQEAKQLIREERLGQLPEGLAMSLRTMGTGVQPSMWQQLKDIYVPTLLMTGELDQKFTELNKKMAEAMPNAVHEKVSNSGHAIHLEKPNFFGKMVLNYLK